MAINGTIVTISWKHYPTKLKLTKKKKFIGYLHIKCQWPKCELKIEKVKDNTKLTNTIIFQIILVQTREPKMQKKKSPAHRFAIYSCSIVNSRPVFRSIWFDWRTWIWEKPVTKPARRRYVLGRNLHFFEVNKEMFLCVHRPLKPTHCLVG